jgi:DNA helicase-2/ATP-dependent DNA helicase PcrA
VEKRLGAHVSVPFVDIDSDYPEATTDDLSLEAWIEAFEASEFSGVTPVAIEAELHMPLGRHIVVCKMDAVFPTETGVHIVDWKTGKPPASAEELAHKALQLAAYRLAWSEWSGRALSDIQASFWFSETRSVITPEHLATKEDLATLLHKALGEPPVV